MTVTIFGSARCLPSSEEYKKAYELGALLAGEGHVVCNGGYSGTMEASARGARENSGSTIGVTVETFGQTANQWIQREVRARNLPERLLKLIELGDAYVVLRGGTGTLLELSAVWEFMNKGQMPPKPFILADFWQPVVSLVEAELKSEGVPGRALLTVATTPAECVKALHRSRR